LTGINGASSNSQAAAYSGAADEVRTADRIAEQEAQLAALLKKRDSLAGL
jgi:hypothetical protein